MNERTSKMFSALMPIGGILIVIVIGVIAYVALSASDVGRALESDGVTTENQ
ncbi:MAG: hypothetical protein AAB573_02530 [Patescibacteria group bacterium]